MKVAAVFLAVAFVLLMTLGSKTMFNTEAQHRLVQVTR